MNTIQQSNIRAWIAVASVRISRNPATMSELYDALNHRRRSRDAGLTQEEEDSSRRHYLSQLRTYGRIETPWRP